MPIRSGLIVLLRLFAILMLFQIAGYMLAVATTLGQADASPLPQIAIASFLLIPFLLIFWSSGPIVDFLAPKPAEVVPEGPVTASDLQAIAFSAAGAFILYLALSHTIGLVAVWHFVSRAPGMPSIPVPQLLQALLGWVVGIFLLLGGPGLRQWLAGLRRAGPTTD